MDSDEVFIFSGFYNHPVNSSQYVGKDYDPPIEFTGSSIFQPEAGVDVHHVVGEDMNVSIDKWFQNILMMTEISWIKRMTYFNDILSIQPRIVLAKVSFSFVTRFMWYLSVDYYKVTCVEKKFSETGNSTIFFFRLMALWSTNVRSKMKSENLPIELVLMTISHMNKGVSCSKQCSEKVKGDRRGLYGLREVQVSERKTLLLLMFVVTHHWTSLDITRHLLQTATSRTLNVLNCVLG